MKKQHSPASTASHVSHTLARKKELGSAEKDYYYRGKRKTQSNKDLNSIPDSDVGVSLAIYVDTQCYEFIKSVMAGSNTLDLPMGRSEAVRYMLRLGMAYIKTLIAHDQKKDKVQADKILLATP